MNCCFATNVVTKDKEFQNVLKDFVEARIAVRVSAGDENFESSIFITNSKNVLPFFKTHGFYIINEFKFKTLDDFNDIRPSKIKKYKTEDDFMKDEYLGKVEEKSKPMGVTDYLQYILGFTNATNEDKKVNTKSSVSLDSEKQKSNKKPSISIGI